MLPTKVFLPEHVVRRAFEHETVLLNLHSGQYHGLNRTGSLLLDAIDRHGDPLTAAKDVADRFDVAFEQVATDLAELLTALAARGLVEVEGG